LSKPEKAPLNNLPVVGVGYTVTNRKYRNILMLKKLTARLLAILLLVAVTLPVAAQDQQENSWPREIAIPGGVVVVYQPQPEKIEGNVLTGRTAVAVELANLDQPIFGAIWFTARLDTDREERIATLAEITITNVRVPEENEAKSGDLVQLLETEMPKWQLPISIDNLLATLEVVDARTAAAEGLKNEPPKIMVTREPAVLIVIDGQPQLRDVDGSSLQRVINTPFTVLYQKNTDTWYLYADESSWYVARDLDGDWALSDSVPAEVSALEPEPLPADESGDEDNRQADGVTPRVVVAMEPTELISIDGAPRLVPVQGTELLYVENTESDLLVDIKGQNYYVLLSGRWFTSKDTEGPWSYTSGDDLPVDFRQIPEASDMGTVLYAVPGTKAAEEAVLDAQMPQTAAVDRSQAVLSVDYDGVPTFKTVEGTSLSHAVNTAVPVIRVENRYYAVDEGVWFVAESPAGPWLVATDVPAVIYTIPPESSLYFVTFVRVYKATDEYVYVGYTPGYTNTYVYNTTVVYGTGYYYPGWYGRYYYPRYSTWGFHVRYAPWGGWRYGFSYSTGPFTFYVGRGGWYRGGWWGPSRYRGYRNGYRHGYRKGYRQGQAAGRHRSSNNLYRSDKNRSRTRATGSAMSKQSRTRVSSNRANNVYTDRSGNVYRDRSDGWDKRSGNSWKKQDNQQPRSQPGRNPESTPQSRPQQQSQPTTAPAKQKSAEAYRSNQKSNPGKDLNRSRDARKRGNTNTRNFNRSRGGGGRRR
jgi:hypothetical protein